MADVAADLKSWSTTASSNSPSDATTIGAGLADNFQEIQKVVRQDLASKGADIASAATTDLGAVPGLFHDITGTTTITGFGTVSAGIWKVLKFEGALTLTHNATSLILPGGVNITTADGDTAIFTSEGSGNWRCVAYAGKNANHATTTTGTLVGTDTTDSSSSTTGAWKTAGGLGVAKAASIGTTLTVGGVTTVNSGATAQGLIVNSTAAGGTYLTIQNSGVGFGLVGDASTLNGGTHGNLALRSGGSAIEFGLAGNRYLQLTSAGLTVTGSVACRDTTVRQGLFYGYSTLGGVSDTDGEILVGSNASAQGRIQYSQAGSVPFVIENTLADASAPVILKANGVNVLSATSSTGVDINGDLSTTTRVKIGTTTNTNGSYLVVQADMSGQNAPEVRNTHAGSSGDYAIKFYRNSTTLVGSVQTTDVATNYVTSSDQDLKIDDGVATSVDVLRNSIVHDGRWKINDRVDRFLFAQEAYLIKPSAVFVGNDELDDKGNKIRPWSIDYSKYVPDLIVGWQDHEARLNALRAEFDAYKAAHP